eukprot:UN07957
MLLKYSVNHQRKGTPVEIHQRHEKTARLQIRRWRNFRHVRIRFLDTKSKVLLSADQERTLSIFRTNDTSKVFSR